MHSRNAGMSPIARRLGPAEEEAEPRCVGILVMWRQAGAEDGSNIPMKYLDWMGLVLPGPTAQSLVLVP